MKKMLFSMIVGHGVARHGGRPVTSRNLRAVSSAAVIAASCGGCGGCGLFHHCCSKCCSTICVRDYNAFSPSFCGNMTFNGCNPFCGGNGAGYPRLRPQHSGRPLLRRLRGRCGAPVEVPGPGAMAMPYGGPAQAAAMAQQYPQSVMPAGVQPNFWTAGYGR